MEFEPRFNTRFASLGGRLIPAGAFFEEKCEQRVQSLIAEAGAERKIRTDKRKKVRVQMASEGSLQLAAEAEKMDK